MENQNNHTRPVLEVNNVSKDFSGIYALKNVDLQIYRAFPDANILASSENVGNRNLP